MDHGGVSFAPNKSNEIMTKYPTTTFPVAELRYQTQHKPQCQTIKVFLIAEYACKCLPFPVCSPHPDSSGYHIMITILRFTMIWNEDYWSKKPTSICLLAKFCPPVYRKGTGDSRKP